jgi:hypothetical protein
VEAGHEAGREWTLEGGLNGAIQVDADGFPPVIHRARVMARETSGRLTASIWVVSQKYTLLSQQWDRSVFLLF